MGEKKKTEARVKTWYKVVTIIACVFVAVLMILSGMGHNWITALRAVQPGDSVTVQVTINDAGGNPLVTTDQQLYEKLISQNKGLFYANSMVIVANKTSPDTLVPVPVYSTGNGWADTFALFGNEYDAISQALVGMKVNDEKTIQLPSAGGMIETWTTDQLTKQGVNLTDVHVGDQLSMAVSGKQQLEKNATQASYSVRIGEITTKSADGITINFGYPTIHIKVLNVATG